MTRISIRELRNQTNSAIEAARSAGEVIVTRHGRDVATLRALPGDWHSHVDAVFDALPPARDTGMLAELAADDELSTDDLE